MATASADRKPSGAGAPISPQAREYFEREASIARTPSDPRHLNPVIPDGARVVCVGCGGGWDGEAVGASRFVGVDIDEDARAFRLERNPNDDFRLASGENLPFEDGEFTFYLARVCVMYMDMRRFFAEASRVLATDGQLWFTCHDFEHEWTHMRRSVRAFRWKDVVYRSYIILNGILYHWFGVLVHFPFKRSRIESFQTRKGMRRGLLLAGFTDVQFPKTEHGQFLVTARKR